MDTLTHGVVGACVATAAAHYCLPDAITAAAVTGFVAGLLPDLDYLFVFAKKPLLAWRYHRVALHNIFILPVLALIATVIVFWGFPLLGFWSVASVLEGVDRNSHLFILFNLALLSLVFHLLCDYITSFGSAFFFPFSRRRFSLGSHFLTDPIVLVIASAGLLFGHSQAAVVILAVYIAISIFLKSCVRQHAQEALRCQAVSGHSPFLFPRPGAPWRWVAVLDQPDHYVFFTITPLSHSSLKWVDKGLGSDASKLYQNDPLLQHFVELSVCPRFEDTLRNGQPAIVIEDIQWWWALPTRPMAFSAIVIENEISQIRETGKFDKGPAGEPALPPLLERPSTYDGDRL